jgi:outer membrane receptor protein involved in Fe transport
MTTPRLKVLLLVTTAFAVPGLAHAQSTAAVPTGPQTAAPASLSSPDDQDKAQTSGAQARPDVSVPGGEIVVTGRRDVNVLEASPQVTSVLSTADIARTGDGNIAGALSRLTGLSVVGNGYVYVRGLGDRYSLALLNGSPLPSPEPLKRVVPLDLFPSNIIASSLVQKSYSANFPGEFGGGVINLTTKAIPEKAFLSIGGSISADTETTGQLGYTYYGSATDWTGFDNGQRNIPPALAAFFASGKRISSGGVATAPIASELVNGRNAVVQRWPHLPPNFSASLSGGTSFDLGSARLGVIAAAGYSNKWTTRDALNQASLQGDLADLESDFRRVTTDDRIVVNGLLGLGLEFGDNKIRWTNLYIRDTLKHTRLGIGNRHGTDVDYLQQDTAWYERQLIDTQVVGEFKLTPDLSLDLRGGYANSRREAPGELSFEYVRTNAAADPYGSYFVNRLNNGNGGDATISYSSLSENLWSGGVDVTYKVAPAVSATVGYAYSDTNRESSRRDFQFQAPNTFPRGVDMFRPDYLLEPAVINNFGVTLVETNEGNPAFRATLRNHAGYLKINASIADTLDLDVGVRYETAREVVSPVEVFSTPGASLAATNLDNSYWLPTATLTWKFRPGMQIRVNGSKTIARPQFRELIYQFYFDPDSNRTYRGNPFLTDSKLTNAEARFEWYLKGDDRISLAGFFKKIDKPIETFVTGDDFTTSFANAPTADLYGVELDAQKHFKPFGWGGPFWSDRRFLVIGNYTYTTSKLKVGTNDSVAVFGSSSTRASDFFRDGSPLTGQSKHLANFQFGLEKIGSLSQQTILVTYASKRATSRGLANSGQPDIFEVPGLRIDFVARQGIKIGRQNVELKFEARNLTGRKYEEFQTSGTNRVDINTYDVGRIFTLSAQINF